MMSPIVYEDPTRKGRPGVHALVVGISAYPNLPEKPLSSSAPVRKNTLGLTKLNSAALGAYQVASWLREHSGQLRPPLASLRLLVAPTEPEISAAGGLAKGASPKPTLNNLKKAAKSWRDAADEHPDNTTLFYFAGHGIQKTIGDDILLLHDFGRDGPILNSTLSTARLIGGMRLLPSRPKRASRQLFFFDACRHEPNILKEYEKPETPIFWDTESIKTDERVYYVFYATCPGSAAYGSVNGHSLFCEALLKCLNGGAAEEPFICSPSPLPWQVTVNSLRSALEHQLVEEASKMGITQTLGCDTNRGVNFEVCTLLKPPKVEIEVNVDPGKATESAALSLLSVTRAPILNVDPPLQDNPCMISAEAGNYIFRAAHLGTPRQYVDPDEFILSIRPPRKKIVTVAFQSV